jgi:hypothetical protein
MAAVPIQIDGVLYDKLNKTQQTVVLMGKATIMGLSVGGGPIIPPDEVPPDSGNVPAHPIVPPGGYPTPGHPIVIPPDPPPVEGQPPGKPTFPIWGPPGIELPPGSGYPPVAGHPLPTPPDQPAKPILGWEAKVFWTPATGWGVVIVPKDDTLVPTPSKR